MSIKIKISKKLKDFIFQEILNSKKLIIISPWISEETAKILLDLAARNIEVNLITTNDSSEFHIRGLKNLISVEKRTKREGNKLLAKLGIFLFIFGIFLTLISFFGIILLIFGIFLFLKYRTIFEKIYFPKIKNLIITKEKLHAKLILTERLIGIGSPNFTYSGLTNNIESFAWIEDKEIYNKLVDEINKLIEKLKENSVEYREIFKNFK
jgi:phosphatidylserine/phosphatidylglycerophosphate/cardiolipin synthase-like enzyme